MKEFFSNFIRWAEPVKYRLIGPLLGLVTAILFLTVGFFKTLLIIICVTAGFVMGYFFDNKADLGNMIDKVMSRVKGDK